MTTEEFKSCKIGDIVICNTSSSGCPQKGWKGRIVETLKSKVGIEWERPFDKGHSLDNNRGKTKRCWYYAPIGLPNETINIIDLYKPEQLEFDF